MTSGIQTAFSYIINVKIGKEVMVAIWNHCKQDNHIVKCTIIGHEDNISSKTTDVLVEYKNDAGEHRRCIIEPMKKVVVL